MENKIIKNITDSDIDSVIHKISTYSDFLEVSELFKKVEGKCDNYDTLNSKLTYIYILGIIQGKRQIRAKK